MLDIKLEITPSTDVDIHISKKTIITKLMELPEGTRIEIAKQLINSVNYDNISAKLEGKNIIRLLNKKTGC